MKVFDPSTLSRRHSVAMATLRLRSRPTPSRIRHQRHLRDRLHLLRRNVRGGQRQVRSSRVFPLGAAPTEASQVDASPTASPATETSPA